jgi:hypothetical protein
MANTIVYLDVLNAMPGYNIALLCVGMLVIFTGGSFSCSANPILVAMLAKDGA